MTPEEISKFQELIEAYQDKKKAEPVSLTSGQCPCCGYCPHCGRGGFHTIPYVPYMPSYPMYPTYPTWPIITCTTSGGFQS